MLIDHGVRHYIKVIKRQIYKFIFYVSRCTMKSHMIVGKVKGLAEFKMQLLKLKIDLAVSERTDIVFGIYRQLRNSE